MPWEIQQRNDEFCVIKTDNNEVEGCHSTVGEAEAQLAALNIAESGNVATNSLHADEEILEPENEVLGGSFHRSLLDAARAIVKFFERRPIEENRPVEFREFKGNSGISVKEIDGKPWHVTWSTNAFLDRDGEFFSTKALENYVTGNEGKEDKGFFDLWHLNLDNAGVDTDFAEKKFQGVIGRFLVEAGPYLENTTGQMAMKFFKQFPDGHPDYAPEGWGCSPRFKFLPGDKATGTYEWLDVIKTSTLPRGEASNIYTKAGQKGSESMTIISEEQLKLGNKIWGEDGFALMIKQGEDVTKELEKDVDFKQVEKENKQLDQPITEIEIPIDEIAKAVGEQVSEDFKSFTDGLMALATVVESGLAEVNKRVDELSQTKMLKDATETPRLVFSLQQSRASGADETIVDKDSDLAKSMPKETKPAGQAQDTFSRMFQNGRQ